MGTINKEYPTSAFRVGPVNPLDAHDIVTTLGTIGVLTALFVETGLLVGLFLPGDSLLFVAGLAASGTARETLEINLVTPS